MFRLLDFNQSRVFFHGSRRGWLWSGGCTSVHNWKFERGKGIVRISKFIVSITKLLVILISIYLFFQCVQKLHAAATDTICAVAEVVPDIDVSSNNNAGELQNFQLMLHGSIMSFSDAYSYAVAEEDQDK